MRKGWTTALLMSGTFLVGACADTTDAEVERAIESVNVIDESNLNDIMLTVGDPNEAAAYFRRASTEQPDRIDLQRGLAISLTRARRTTEAVAVWKRVTDHPEATSDDRVDFAEALIRAGEWDRAEAMLDSVPPTYETFKRYRLEAMISDSNQEWDRADSFYETAVGLTTTPAGVLNNWGYSKLSRGDFDDAERLFVEAIGHDASLFTTKNNLILARGAQRKYDLPVVPMTQTERAQLLHTLALTAIKQNDLTTGKALLEEAIESHPQHFESAVRALEALQAGALN